MQAVFHDKYFKTRDYSLLLLSPENCCKICDKGNMRFKMEK